jgi:hypothetical protein
MEIYLYLEREREREREREIERERERASVCVCVCVCVWKRVRQASPDVAGVFKGQVGKFPRRLVVDESGDPDSFPPVCSPTLVC